MLNAVADDASSADSPTVAPITWTTEPVCTPATVTRPALRPWATVRATMNSTAGPGTTSSARQATANRSSVGRSGMVPDGTPGGYRLSHLFARGHLLHVAADVAVGDPLDPQPRHVGV